MMSREDQRILGADLERHEDLPTEIEKAEFRLIRRRRHKALTGKDPTAEIPEPEEPEEPQHERDLIGLAFSGGGIRSATFGLGVLQGLAELDVLKFVDYLSTVSGGGYIGGWFAAWVKREGSLDNVVQQLKPQRTDQADAIRGFACDKNRIEKHRVVEPEPEPVFHLRQYSNYLSPRLSIFSVDTWALAAVYLRNLLANLLVLVPAILAVFFFVRLLAWHFSYWSKSPPAIGDALCGIAMVTLLAAFIMIALSLTRLKQKETRDVTSVRLSGGWFAIILILLGATALLMTWLLVPATTALLPPAAQPGPVKDMAGRFSWWTMTQSNLTSLDWNDLVKFAAVFGLLHGFAALARGWANWRAIPESPWAFNHWWPLACGILSGMVGGGLLYLVLSQILWPCAPNPGVVLTLGPSLFLLVFALGAICEVAMLGILADESEREWWNQLVAWLMILSVTWSLFCGIALYGALWLEWLNGSMRTGLFAGWVTTALGGLWAARSSRTNGKERNSWQEGVSLFAPYVFLLGLLCLTSWFANFLMTVQEETLTNYRPRIEAAVPRVADPVPEQETTEVVHESTQRTPFATSNEQTVQRRRVMLRRDEWGVKKLTNWFVISNPPLMRLNWLLVGTALLSVGMSFRVDVNEFSLNAMYANRLTRCYLGASRRKAKKPAPPKDWGTAGGAPGHSHGSQWFPNRVTGFDPDDDLELRDLLIGEKEDPPTPKPNDLWEELPIKEIAQVPYWGPFPLFNTSLNLVAGDELAWQERMAESFVLSPLFCGANSLGYCPTTKYSSGLKLGRAVAISGAAANPNMGYHSSPATSAMMTFFNVRLGWWLPNPKDDSSWRDVRPSFLLKWLSIELFSRTSSQRRFLNISDGGHFENLGVYELVRRRCRCIIVSDAGADPNYEFEDLAGLIRKCRADFGIDIEIDLDQLRPKKDSSQTERHCAIGTIRYDNVEPTAPVGVLIYLKPSLTGHESSDIRHYSGSHPDFPHQPTLDQFFNESQFESYRALGYHIAHEVFGEVVERLRRNDNFKPAEVAPTVAETRANVKQKHHGFAINFAYWMQKKWLSRPAGMDASFLESIKPFVELHQDLRREPALQQVSQDLYPEFRFAAGASEPASASQSAPLLKLASTAGLSARREEIHLAMQMLQVMENAWLGLNLNEYHAHPLNAGWMNFFQRWGNTDLFRRYWHVLRHEFSGDFVQFCERELPVKLVVGPLQYLEDLPCAATEFLFEEFHRDWPKEQGATPPRSLDALLQRAFEFDVKTPKPRRAFWVMSLESQLPASNVGDRSNSVLAGVIGLCPLQIGQLPKDSKYREAADKHAEVSALRQALRTTQSCEKQIVQERLAEAEKSLEKLPQAFELIVWVRPAFRQQKVGQKMIESLLFGFDWDQYGKPRPPLNNGPALGDLSLWDRSGKPGPLLKLMGDKPLVTLFYPKAGWTGAGNKLSKKLWMSYFSFYDFRRPKPTEDWPQRDDYEILHWPEWVYS